MCLIRVVGVVCFVVVLIVGCCFNEDQQQVEGENIVVIQQKFVFYSNFLFCVSYGDGEYNCYESIYIKNGIQEIVEIQDKFFGVKQEGEEVLDEMKMILSEFFVID